MGSYEYSNTSEYLFDMMKLAYEIAQELSDDISTLAASIQKDEPKDWDGDIDQIQANLHRAMRANGINPDDYHLE